MTTNGTPEPAEIVFTPKSSWGPPFFALGLVLAFVGAYLWWPYAVVGAIIGLAALRSWYGQAAEEIDEMPRHQDPVTDVIPPVTK